MIHFVENINKINTDEAFVANILGANERKEDLLNEMKEKFLFPDYFGNNWDALYDCLCDLTWINASKIILIHKEIPITDDKSLKVYLNILNDTIESWKTDTTKNFEIYFELKDKTIIVDALNNLVNPPLV